jgi:hypothetical protein
MIAGMLKGFPKAKEKSGRKKVKKRIGSPALHESSLD